MSGDDDAPQRPRGLSRLDPDLDIMAKSREEVHESLNRESVEVVVLECRHLRLIDSEQPGGVSLGKPSGSEYAIDLDAQPYPCIELGGIREPEIRKYVP
jgi:hypothetical protein